MFGFHERFRDEEIDDEESDECTFTDVIKDSLEEAAEFVDQYSDKICAGIVGIGAAASIITGTPFVENPFEEEPISFIQEVTENNFGDNISAMVETIENYDDLVEDLSDDEDDSTSDGVSYSDEPY